LDSYQESYTVEVQSLIR